MEQGAKVHKEDEALRHASDAAMTEAAKERELEVNREGLRRLSTESLTEHAPTGCQPRQASAAN